MPYINAIRIVEVLLLHEIVCRSDLPMFGKCEAQLPISGISAHSTFQNLLNKNVANECYNEVDIPNIVRGFLRV